MVPSACLTAWPSAMPKVADRLHRNVDAGVPGQQVEHMVKEPDPGGNLGHAGSVEVHGDLDIGLFGLPLDRGRAHECFP